MIQRNPIDKYHQSLRRHPRLAPASRLAAALLAGALLAGLAGCVSQRAKGSGDYQTVDKNPSRDTDAARKLDEQAVVCINRGDWVAAEALLRKALDADVMFGPAHNNLGRVLFHNRDLYEAAWEYQYASKLMPRQPEPRNNLGLVFEAAGKLDDAISWYDQAHELDPDNNIFLGNLARAHLRRGDHDDDVKNMLSRLLLIDNRPQWVEWARRKLAFWKNQLPPATMPDIEG